MGRVGHYFEERPASPSARRTVRLRLPDAEIDLMTDRGVFSGTHVDLGTRLLLREAPPPDGGPVLDLGCGYGPIAVVLARRAPSVEVWAVDVNERALALTRDNAAALGLTNVTVAKPDDVPTDLRLAAIYSNPPVRVGKEALHRLLLDWLPRLEDGARAWLVVQRNLGADSLARWLDNEGWPAARRASRSGYRLLEVHRT
jgi:16S rRNA G1207 methylase RsmC